MFPFVVDGKSASIDDNATLTNRAGETVCVLAGRNIVGGISLARRSATGL